MDTPTPESSSWLIQFIVAAIGAIGVALAAFFKGVNNPEKPSQKILTAEIADTTAVAAKVVSDIRPLLEQSIAYGIDRDRKIDEILIKLQSLENEQEVARRAREEVARQLASERRDRER